MNWFHLAFSCAFPKLLLALLFTALTDFVLFPAVLIVFLLSSGRQSKMFSWIYLHSSLDVVAHLPSGSQSVPKPAWGKTRGGGEKGVFALKLKSDIEITFEHSVQQYETVPFVNLGLWLVACFNPPKPCMALLIHPYEGE